MIKTFFSNFLFPHKIIRQFKKKLDNKKFEIKAERVSIASIELDQYTGFEGAMKLFKREVNNSNVVVEMRRRRYHEETWLARRRKEKERTMKVKFPRNVVTFDEKNPMSENTVFTVDYNAGKHLRNPWRHKRHNKS